MGDRTVTGAAQPQAGSGAQPQAGDAATTGQEPAATTGQEPAAGAGDAAGGATTDGETAEARAARLDRENADLRKEQAANRKKLQALEAEKQAAAQAGMTELEREQAARKAAEERTTELEARVRTQALRSATATAATKQGFRSPEVAYRLLDQGSIEYDAAGEPTNIDKLLAELAKAEPYLVKTATGGDYGGGHRGTQPEGKPGMNELMKAALGKG